MSSASSYVLFETGGHTYTSNICKIFQQVKTAESKITNLIYLKHTLELVEPLKVSCLCHFIFLFYKIQTVLSLFLYSVVC